MSDILRGAVRERMGSGGLRGLQILRSGASRVRGGFDSHAFPPLPCVALTLTLLAGWAPAAAAQFEPEAGAADSLARLLRRASTADSIARADSAAGVIVIPPRRLVAPDTAITERALASAGRRVIPISQLPRWDQPRWVMLRSLVVPGWGQWHNGSWFKAGGVAAAEILLGSAILGDERELDRLNRVADAAEEAQDEAGFDAAVAAYNTRLEQTINRRWMVAGVLAYALLDAYVDAHFRHFDVEFEAEPASPGILPAGPGGRLNLRWRF